MAATPTTMPQDEFWGPLVSLVSLREIPTRADFISKLSELGAPQGILLVILGLVFLLNGWKSFKILVLFNAALLGALVGNALGGLLDGPNMTAIASIAGAVLFAVLAWPLMKMAIGLMGALAGSFLGYGLWNYIADLSGSETLGQNDWAGALIGFLLFGMLAFVIFQKTLIIFTSLQGSLLIVSGCLAVLMKLDQLRPSLENHLTNNVHLLPLLILLPAVTGFVHQQAGVSKKKKKKASQGSDG